MVDSQRLRDAVAKLSISGTRAGQRLGGGGSPPIRGEKDY